MALSRPLLFVRGLNTFGTDLLTLGPVPLPFMEMHRPWCDFFKSQGVQTFFVEGLGGDRIYKQIQRAKAYLNKNSDIFNDGFHIVGHSAGGLIGWALASDPEWNTKVLSLTTLATPHRGAYLAELYLRFFDENNPRTRVLSSLGYKGSQRAPIFKDFTPQGVEEFKRQHPLPDHLPVASYSFSIQPPQMSWPVRWTHYFGLKVPNKEYDGFVEVDSQCLERNLAHYELDHLSQIGYHFYLNPRERALRKKIFSELAFSLLNHLSHIDKSADKSS